MLLAQPASLQARQDFVTEEWKLVDIVDQRDGDPGQSGLAEIDEMAGHVVGIADNGSPSHALRISGSNLRKLVGWRVLRRNILEREDAIDGRPVGVLHDGIMIIVLGLLPGRPAGDDAYSVNAEFPALRIGLAFGIG